VLEDNTLDNNLAVRTVDRRADLDGLYWPVNFEWDLLKDAANQQKHGISFEEASTVFGDHSR
jgi:hypothetical protein